jgi:outer membrane protein TolC
MSKTGTPGFLLILAAAAAAVAEPPPPAPLTLAAAVARALASAPELAAARAGAGASEAAAREAAAPFSPELWLSTTPGYSSGLPVAVAGRVPAIAGVELRQTLFSPEVRSESLEALARQALAAGETEASLSATVRETIELYGRCWRDQARVAAAREECDARDALARSVEAAVREGRLLRLDLERSELDDARARQKLQAAESDLDLGLWELRRRTGWPGGVPLVLAEEPLRRLPESLSGDDMPAACSRDPETLALEARVEALERARGSLSPLWSPVVEAQAQYARLSRANGYDEFYKKFKADDWSVGVSVGIPLWSTGRGARQARMRELAEEARARRLEREWKLDAELRQARSELERSLSARSLALRERALEREALDQARLLAGEGRGEPGAVEKESVALAGAEDGAARADFDLLSAKLRLLALRGELADLFPGTAAGGR